VYKFKGESVPLSWAYDLNGAVIDWKEWTFDIDQRIATVLSTGAIDINPAFASSVDVSGDTLRLLNIQEKDSGNYIFRVQFTTFTPEPFIVNWTQLIVVGKFSYPYSSLHVNLQMNVLCVQCTDNSVMEKLQMSLNCQVMF